METVGSAHLLSVKQVAEHLNISVRCVYGYIENRKIRAEKIGATTVVTRQDLEEFKRKNNNGVTQGRPRTRAMRWKKSDQYIMAIRANVKDCDQFSRKLHEIFQNQACIASKVSSQQIIRSKENPRDILLVFTWRKINMPSQEEITAFIERISKDFKIERWQQTEWESIGCAQ
jgi:excisionase family DNA binding protein